MNTAVERMVLAVLLCLPAPALAQQAAPRAAVPQTGETVPAGTLEAQARGALAVMRGQQLAANVFAPAFLAQVSPAMLAEVTRQLKAAHGAPVAIESVRPTSPYSADIAIRFERATAKGVMTLETDAPYRITGFLLREFVTADDSTAKVEAEIKALPGRNNALLAPLDGGEPVLAHNAQTPLALGSTFKLYVLLALSEAIAKGEHRWDEVVPLSASSYPSGLTQDWPAGTPITVQSLATLMLQVSDNTATDQLITLLGRSRVEAVFRRTGGAATPTLPFLTTREMFTIKASPAVLARYAKASEAERRTLLAGLPRDKLPLPTVAAVFGGNPVAIDTVEWFASPIALRQLLSELAKPEYARARSLMTVNRNLDEGVAARWAFAGFKGGSEPGVLNLTWLLQDKGGRWHILTLGWSDPSAPVDTARLDALAKRLLALATP